MISTPRVMLAVCAIVLSLTSLACSAPLACEGLLRPLDQVHRHHLEGKWALIAGSVSDPHLNTKFGLRDSSTTSFSNTTGESNMLFIRSMRLDNTCQYGSDNVSLEDNRMTFNNNNITTTFIHTCHDCILMSSDVESGKRLHFYLFSRRRQLEKKEMEEYRAQVDCLNLPAPAVMDPTKELCPDEADYDPTAQPEEKTEGKKD
uniref:Uncharacterized protein n=1 Tax=Mastacembelus armatus TaxID=205130 RepID=A0A3Q3KQ68_9TELE